MSAKLLMKRGLKSQLPVLDVGEPGFCSDTKELFIGTSNENVQFATVGLPQDVTFLNGWGNYGYSFEPLMAIKLGNLVSASGLIIPGVTTYETTIALLPVDHRPATHKLVRYITDNKLNPHRISIYPTGEIKVQLSVDPGTGSFYSVDIQFRC